MKPFLSCLLLAGLSATAADAEGTWIAGVIADADQSPYVGGRDSVELLPYLAFEADRLHVGIDGVRYELIDQGNLSVSLTLDPRFSPDFPDTALFAGLDRDDALEAGFSATYSFGAAYVGMSVQGDVTGVHDGFAGRALVGYEADLGPVALDVNAGVYLRDANLNTYLYGVSVGEVTAARPMFEMGNTINVFADVTALMPIGDRTFLLGQISYHDLGEAVDSPLVTRGHQLSITVGIGYQF